VSPLGERVEENKKAAVVELVETTAAFWFGTRERLFPPFR